MTSFRLQDFLPYQLSVASNAVSRAVADGTGYEERFGLSAAEWRVLAAISAAGTPTQAEVCAFTAMDKMTVSRAVAGLSHRRLIDRDRDTRDRRTLRLAATDEGRRIHDLVAPRALEVERRLLETLDDDEVRTLCTALAKLRRAASPTDNG